MFWVILLWVNPQNHHVEWAEQYGPAYESFEDCQAAKVRLDVPAVLVRNKEGVQLFPGTTCMADNSRPKGPRPTK